MDTIVLSLTAEGLTTGEVSAHFAEIYGASLSKDTISRITDRVVTEMAEWMARPLEKVYAAVFIDAIFVKIRDGQVGNRPIYVAIGVDLAGHEDILGLWAGTGGGESAKFWLHVLTELKNRGVEDVVFVICDGLKGLPDSVGAVFGQAIVQTCVIHLIRYASKKYWGQIATDLKPIYGHRPGRRPGRRSRSSRRSGASPTRRSASCGARQRRRDPQGALLDQRIESLNACYRRAVSVRWHFPTEQAALKCLYMVTRSLDPKSTDQTRWTMRWSRPSTRSR